MYGQYHYEQHAEYVQYERLGEADRDRQVREAEAAQNGNKQRRIGGEVNRAVSALRLVFSR